MCAIIHHKGGDHVGTLFYERLLYSEDLDISVIRAEMDKPEVARFLSYDKENYWKYVTETENVFYYKVYAGDSFIGGIHLETDNDTLYMSILVFEAYRKNGVGAKIINDLLNGAIPVEYGKICVSVARDNVPSVRLFEKMGFKSASEEEELINFILEK